MSQGTKASDIGLPGIMRFFGRHRWVILGTSLTFFILATMAAFYMTPVYRAEIMLVPVKESGGGAMSSLLSNFGGLGVLSGLGKPQSSRKGEALAMLRSRAFLFEFFDKHDVLQVLYAGLWDSDSGKWTVPENEVPTVQRAYRRFINNIMTVSEDDGTGTVSVSIDWKDRFIAAQWANDLIAMLNETLRARVAAEAQKSIEYLNSELEEVGLVGLRQAIYRLIEAQIETIMLTNVRQEFVFRVIDPAVPPDSDRFVRPQRLRISIIGLFFGLFSGIFIAAVWDAFKTASRVEHPGGA